MSADLLAAFSTGSTGDQRPQGPESREAAQPFESKDDTWQPWPLQPSQSPGRPSTHKSNERLWKTNLVGADILFDAEDPEAFSDDDFGAFEQVEQDQDASRVDQPSRAAPTEAPQLIDLTDTPVGSTTIEEHKIDPPNGADLSSQLDIAGACLKPALALVEPRGIEDDDDDDDDWGHFEITTPEVACGLAKDREKVDPSSRPTRQPSLPSTSSRARNLAQNPPKIKPGNSTATIEAPQQDEFDVWDDFESAPADEPVLNTSERLAVSPQNAKEIASTTSRQQERPTNVPPPAVLLALLGRVLSILASQAQQPGKIEEKGTSALRAYKVSARIIAGRSQRWKRDTILSQSVKIGAAGRSGGMKLTAIDRGESRKEDQAAEDLINTWMRVSHALNQAMAKAKVPKPPISLSTKLTMRTATGIDVINANHICPICGLKRNERINGIDVHVSDTFSEFWIEKWGHSDCHKLWYSYNELLDQR